MRRKTRQELEAEAKSARPSKEEDEVVRAFFNLLGPWFVERPTYMLLLGFPERDPGERHRHWQRIASRLFRPSDEEFRRMKELMRIAGPLCYVAECADQTVEQWLRTPHPGLVPRRAPIDLLFDPDAKRFDEWVAFVRRCIDTPSP